MARSETGQIDPGTVLVAASGVVVAIAAFLAWLTQDQLFGGSEAITGMELFSQANPLFSGVATLVLAIVAVVVTLLAPANRQANVGVVVIGILIALIGLVVLVSPETVFGSGFFDQVAASASNPAIGLYLTLLGGIGVFAGGLMSYAG